MSQTIGNSPAPAGSMPPPLGVSTVGQAVSAAERAELIRRIEADRQGLAQMMADRATRARHIAQLDAQITDLKKHGSQLVKRLQVARQAASSHERTMLALRERIAAAEQRLMGGIPHSLGDRTVSSMTAVAAHGVTLAAEPRTPAATKSAGVVAPTTAKKARDATSHRNGAPAQSDADDYIMLDEDPLIGRLVEYQSRQMRPERRRRAALSAFLFFLIVAGLAGFSLLLFRMMVDDPLKHDGQRAAQEQTEQGVPPQPEPVVASAPDG